MVERGELPKDERKGRSIARKKAKESQQRDLRDQSVDATDQGPKGTERFKGSQGRSDKRNDQGIEGNREGSRDHSRRRSSKHRDQGIEGSSVEGQSKGRTYQDRRLLKHYQRPIKGAKV